MVSVHSISFELNGTTVSKSVGPEVLLVDLLRDDIGLTGTKIGCSIGVCGACSVLVDGSLVSGCLMLAIMVDGRKVTTIEGIAPAEGELSPLQDAFIRKGGFQCGICTSGQIIAATALLAQNAKPNREEIKEWMMGNLCRCTGYYKIIDSIEAAAGSNVKTFDYKPAASIDEALAALKEYGDEVELIAGGTSLVLMMQQGLVQPAIVVGLGDIAELRGIKRTADGGLEVGAMTTHRQLETSPEAFAFAAALPQSLGVIATIRVRNQATLGGNLVHADPAQDPPPVLIALDALVDVVSDGNAGRLIPMEDFFTDFFETSMAENELLRSVKIPPMPAGSRLAYKKFLPRTEDDYATVSVAVRLGVADDGVCTDLRIGLGALGVTPLRAKAVEAALLGQKLTASVIRDAAALVRDEVDPLDDVRGSAKYKREMARVWTERTIGSLAKVPA